MAWPRLPSNPTPPHKRHPDPRRRPDKAVLCGIEMGDEALSLLRSSRKQVEMAFKQAARGRRLEREKRGLTSLTPALVTTVGAASFPT